MHPILKDYNHSFTGSIPPLARPSKEKDEKLYRKVLDALEHIGTVQYIENSKYEDVLRMIDGKQSVKEAKEILPYLQPMQSSEVIQHIPFYIRHYDLIGQIINSVAETYMITKDEFFVHAVDPFSTNEYIRTKDMLSRILQRRNFTLELTQRLEELGVETDLSRVQFDSEEDLLEYQQYVDQMGAELTPQKIETYINSGYKLGIINWATETLASDKLRFSEDGLIRENIRQCLATGKCFRHIRAKYDTYEPENWSVRDTFHSKETRRRFLHKTEYIGRITYNTSSQLINTFGHLLPSKTVERMSNGWGMIGTYNGVLPPHLAEPFSDKPSPILPSPDYLNRQYVNMLEDVTGQPLTTKVYEDGCGEAIVTKGFGSKPFPFPAHAHGVLNALRFHYGGDIRDDIYQTTEVYFTDYQRMGLLCLENEYGVKIFERVSDEILGDMLSDLGIKQLKKKSLVDFQDEAEANSIVWYYEPYSRYGLKINFACKDVKDFYYTEKTRVQVKSNNSIFEVIHPVVGIETDCIGEKLEVYQNNYNYYMNEITELTEKELGIFFLFDRAFMSTLNHEGQANESLETAVNIIKSLGFMDIDTSQGNMQQAIQSGQFHPIDVTVTKQIQSRMALAQMYRQYAYDLIGVKLGQNAPPDAYKTATGVTVDREAMYAQLEHYYAPFTDFLAEVYTVQLAVAQWNQAYGEDVSTTFSRSDGSHAVIEVSDPNFPLRRLGVVPTSNSKERANRELMKQYILNNNTVMQDPLAALEVLHSDDVSKMITAVNESIARQQQEIAQANEAASQLENQRAENQRNNEYYTWWLQEQSKERDRETRLREAGIRAMGTALYRDTDPANAQYIASQTR